MKYLVFEDFNTKGLEGDPHEFEYDQYRDPSKPHNFYYFWRAYGISGKSGKMGSWGIGKSVFPASSQINCFWAVTLRESDKKAYLIGQSVLKTHNLKDRPAPCGYLPYGYYANFDEEDFPTPESSVDEIKNFSQLFKLKRDVESHTNTGLSIVVPFPKEDITVHSLTLSTIQQFFYAIVLEKLEIEIAEEDTVVILNASTLLETIQKIDVDRTPGFSTEQKNTLISQAKFAQWAISVPESNFIKLNFKNPRTAYEWRKKELFEGIGLEDLQKKFDIGEPLAFSIPVKFQPEGSSPELRYFNGFIQKDEELVEPENCFIREFLAITGVKSLKRKGVRGLVVISNKDLVTFFGQAEGPAHTGWHSGNFRAKYENVDECISFVQRSLERIYSFLLLPAEGIEKDLLKDFFYINDDTETEKGEKSRNTGNKEDVPTPDIPIGIPKGYAVSKIDGGFRIAGKVGGEPKVTELSICVAYIRADGRNPFKKYSEFDFNLNAMPVKLHNAEVISQDKNMIKLDIKDDDFYIEVVGFDHRRDLIIDVKQ